MSCKAANKPHTSESAAKQKLCGVYSITNLKNGKLYVGSTSLSFKARWAEHIREFRKGQNSPHLQAAWNRYGNDCFQFAVLEITEPENAVQREQFWLDHTKAFEEQVGYCICTKAESNRGIRHTVATKVLMSKSKSDSQSRERMSRQMKAFWSDPQNGAAQSERMRIRMKEYHSNPKVKAAYSARLKKLHADPEYRAAMSAKLRAKNADPVYKAFHSATVKAGKLRSKLARASALLVILSD
jgi:group I intron endonuclease